MPTRKRSGSDQCNDHFGHNGKNRIHGHNEHKGISIKTRSCKTSQSYPTSRKNLQLAINNEKDKWNNMENIPKGNDFKSQLCMGFSSSTRGSGRAYVKCSLLTHQHLALIKYSNAVVSYIQQEKIYVNYDTFDTKVQQAQDF
jgi:hypothetical protein